MNKNPILRTNPAVLGNALTPGSPMIVKAAMADASHYLFQPCGWLGFSPQTLFPSPSGVMFERLGTARLPGFSGFRVFRKVSWSFHFSKRETESGVTVNGVSYSRDGTNTSSCSGSAELIYTGKGFFIVQGTERISSDSHWESTRGGETSSGGDSTGPEEYSYDSRYWAGWDYGGTPYYNEIARQYDKDLSGFFRVMDYYPVGGVRVHATLENVSETSLAFVIDNFTHTEKSSGSYGSHSTTTYVVNAHSSISLSDEDTYADCAARAAGAAEWTDAEWDRVAKVVSNTNLFRPSAPSQRSLYLQTGSFPAVLFSDKQVESGGYDEETGESFPPVIVDRPPGYLRGMGHTNDYWRTPDAYGAFLKKTGVGLITSRGPAQPWPFYDAYLTDLSSLGHIYAVAVRYRHRATMPFGLPSASFASGSSIRHSVKSINVLSPGDIARIVVGSSQYGSVGDFTETVSRIEYEDKIATASGYYDEFGDPGSPDCPGWANSPKRVWQMGRSNTAGRDNRLWLARWSANRGMFHRVRFWSPSSLVKRIELTLYVFEGNVSPGVNTNTPTQMRDFTMGANGYSDFQFFGERTSDDSTAKWFFTRMPNTPTIRCFDEDNEVIPTPNGIRIEIQLRQTLRRIFGADGNLYKSAKCHLRYRARFTGDHAYANADITDYEERVTLTLLPAGYHSPASMLQDLDETLWRKTGAFYTGWGVSNNSTSPAFSATLLLMTADGVDLLYPSFRAKSLDSTPPSLTSAGDKTDSGEGFVEYTKREEASAPNTRSFPVRYLMPETPVCIDQLKMLYVQKMPDTEEGGLIPTFPADGCAKKTSEELAAYTTYALQTPVSPPLVLTYPAVVTLITEGALITPNF